MRALQAIFGLLLILGGIVGGLYVGIWLMLIGGIVDVINAAQTTPVPAVDVGIGVVKVLFAGLVGWLSGILPIIFGAAVVADA